MANMAKKIDKEFVLSDSSVNCYGFRLMTSGCLIEEFKKNPIGYIMHDREKGVAVRWEDLRIDGDRLIGKPVINLAYPNAQQVIDSIENGFLNAASVGHIVALEVSNDPAWKLPGQDGPTITKWHNRECSLVDIPGNFNALKLFDQYENEIALKQLASLCANSHKPNSKPNEPLMKELKLSPAHAAALSLRADADESAVAQALDALLAKADKAAQFETERNAAKTELSALKTAHANAETERILADALKAKKCTKEMAEKLRAKFDGDPDGLKDLTDSFHAYVPLAERDGNDDKEYAALAAKSFDQLMESGEMAQVKTKYPELYAEKLKSIKTPS